MKIQHCRCRQNAEVCSLQATRTSGTIGGAENAVARKSICIQATIIQDHSRQS